MEAPDKGAVDQLRAYVDRLERLIGDREDIGTDIRAVRAEAKSHGFDLPTIRDVLKRRRMGTEEVMTADGLLETYEQALGCGAAAVGTLETKRGADGTFHVSIAAPDAAAKKLSKATMARRSAMALAAAAAMAREA